MIETTLNPASCLLTGETIQKKLRQKIRKLTILPSGKVNIALLKNTHAREFHDIMIKTENP